MCRFLVFYLVFLVPLIFHFHSVASLWDENEFECYFCQSEIFNQIDQMKKDNCYSLEDKGNIEKCES